MLLKKKELKKTQIASFSTSPKIPDLRTNLQSIEVSKGTELILSCLQDPTVQSTLIFIGVVVVVVCWQQFAVSALIQGALYGSPVASIPTISSSEVSTISLQHLGRHAGKLQGITCFDLQNLSEKLSLSVGFKNDYLYKYHYGKSVCSLGDSLDTVLKFNPEGCPQASLDLLKMMATEVPRLISQFEKVPFSNPDLMITQIVVTKSKYLFLIDFYPPGI